MLNPRCSNGKHFSSVYIKTFSFRRSLIHFTIVLALVRSFSIAKLETMAPTGDDIHELVAKLEARVKELEAKVLKYQDGAPNAAKDGQSVRMILIGPPGAGKTCHCLPRLCAACLCLPLFTDLPSLDATFLPLSMANLLLQERARKRRKSRRDSHAVILWASISS